MKPLRRAKPLLTSVLLSGLIVSGCNIEFNADHGAKKDQVDTQVVTDALYQFAIASRNAYASNVVGPLSVQRNILPASEHWKTEHVLPIPAQFIRYASENFNASTPNVSIHLKSLWPINDANSPASELEKQGLQQVFDQPSNPFYGEEKLDNKRYFTAIYADTASNLSCIQCHNTHANSPKKDFRGGDVIGGFIVRLELQDK